tara:strand:+ start:75 stop:347 length:273 start_codon:yes stop_codon:yes gene_type:complete
MELHIKELKNFISKNISDKIKNNETPAINFNDKRHENDVHGSEGHIQYNISRGDWAVFLNYKCIYVSRTLISAIKKLDRLNIFVSNFEIN